MLYALGTKQQAKSFKMFFNNQEHAFFQSPPPKADTRMPDAYGLKPNAILFCIYTYLSFIKTKKA